MSSSLCPCGLQLAGSICPRDSPGKNTGVGCHVLLQGIFPTHEWNSHLLHLLHWQAGSLKRILKSRDITLPTKVRLVKAIVFPVVMYGCESWTIKKTEYWRIDAFELWGWRRPLRVPWTARRSNQSILKEVLNIHWKDWCWSWSSNTLVTWCKEPTHWKRSWFWGCKESGTTQSHRQFSFLWLCAWRGLIVSLWLAHEGWLTFLASIVPYLVLSRSPGVRPQITLLALTGGLSGLFITSCFQTTN